jgi:hypothetical protein
VYTYRGVSCDNGAEIRCPNFCEITFPCCDGGISCSSTSGNCHYIGDGVSCNGYDAQCPPPPPWGLRAAAELGTNRCRSGPPPPDRRGAGFPDARSGSDE